MPIWQEIEAIWWQISDAYTPAAAAHVARKWAKHPHVDDLRSEAILSITGAAQNFDTTRGVKFSYYLTLCMRRAIQHWLAKQSRHVAVSIDNTLHQVKISEHGEVMTNPAYDAVSEATMVPLDTPEGNPAYYLEEKADKEQLDIRRQIINVVLSTLSQRKKSICVHILDGVSRKDTATAVGVSPTHVQNTWREFKQLCRDQFAKRPLVVA
jgi:RNA polymerase sigma factor (sigma-70 family)